MAERRMTGRLLPRSFLLLVCLGVARIAAAQRDSSASTIRIDAYRIDVALSPAQHRLSAKTTVSFTAMENAAAVSFQLNPALTISNISDAGGVTLEATRSSTTTLGGSANDSILRVIPARPLHKGDSAAWTFLYSGTFQDSGRDHAANPQLALIGEPVSYLLYAAQWFPVSGSMTDRFTATMHVHVPVGERALGSGPTGTPHLDGQGQTVFDFDWKHSGFPGTVVAGQFSEPYAADPDSNVRIYLYAKGTKAKFDAQKYATTAFHEYEFLWAKFGGLDSNQLNIVELPEGSVPAYSAPELAAIAGAQMQEDSAPRLLANTIAHQWWGERVSPATPGDAWITNGMCRYAELSYVERYSGEAVLQQAVLDASAAALAYDTFPLIDAGRYLPFSPEFQSMTYDKGAMVFRMLQWQLGDAAFDSTLRAILSQKADASISTVELEKTAESASHQNLQPFFTQWIDSTGAPTLLAKWTLYRLGNNQGFRTMGSIDQDLDLFQMPVEMRIETEGKTVTQRIEAVGAHSQFSIDSFGMPRKVSLDPDHRLLRNSPEMQVRVHILRGQQKAASGDDVRAIQEYQQALAIDSVSSLASYRLGDVYLDQRNYQAAADAYRAALRGDGEPKWTEVWSDLQLGKVFDASGQRERALNQYREALQTGDNTGGALDLARAYLQKPYKGPAQAAP